MNSVDVLREYRNILLNLTDRYILPDFPHDSDAIKQSWIIYRQNLRDLTTTQSPSLDTNGNLIGVTWPIDPNGESGPRDPGGVLIN